MIQTELTRLKRTVARLKREKALIAAQRDSLLAFKQKFESKLVRSLVDLAEEFGVFLTGECD